MQRVVRLLLSEVHGWFDLFAEKHLEEALVRLETAELSPFENRHALLSGESP